MTATAVSWTAKTLTASEAPYWDEHTNSLNNPKVPLAFGRALFGLDSELERENWPAIISPLE